MSQTIREFIESLELADEQLDKLLTHRKKLQPQFKFKCDITTIISKDLKCLYISKVAARSIGLESIDNLPLEIREPINDNIKEVFYTGKTIKAETKLFPISQEYYYFEYTLQPILTSCGDIAAVMCNLTDITERKLVEIDLSNQIAKFNQLLDLCPMAIYVVDKQGTITTVNKNTCFNQSALIGKPYKFITVCLGIDYEKSVMVKALNGIETRQEFLSISDRKYLINALPIREQPTGNIVGAIGIYSNITEYEKFREENQKKQQGLLSQYLNENKKLNQLIDLCPFGIVLHDQEGKVSAINKAYFEWRLPNFKKEDFVGWSGQYLAEALGLRWENTASYRALKGTEILNCYSKKSYGTYLINAVPLRNFDNVIIGSMTVIHDITEYEKLKEEMTKLDRLNLVGEMAAGVAHEIRNPMTVIKGYLQFLSKKVSDSMAEQFCTVLCELERIEQIISDFLSLARNNLTEYKEQDLNAIIREIIPLISVEAIKQGIEVETNLVEDIPSLILNEKEIKQLLLNLIRNSMEAMNQHGILTIETKIIEDAVCLFIADCGCGICKEYQSRIFDPFFTTKDNGTGLGLAVCAGIVRRHNGTIEVQSEEGKGTQFIIAFKKM